MIVRSIPWPSLLMLSRELVKFPPHERMKNRKTLLALPLIIQDGLEQLQCLGVPPFRVIHRTGAYDPLLLPETCRMTEPGRGVL